MESGAFYPFAAIVGQDEAKRALLIAAVNPKAGGLLLGGAQGTGKSTLVRSLDALSGAPRRVDLPLGVTEDRLLGGLDVEYAVAQGKRRLLPGLLACADGKLLYIDEVNLLPREMLKWVLGICADGFQIVEREGLSARCAARATVVGTMNPAEGALEQAVLERFGLYAQMEEIADAAQRAEIVRRRLDYERDRQAFCTRYGAAEEALSAQLAKARKLAPRVEASEAMLLLTAQLCARARVAGHRAELYLLETAKAIAALDERDHVLPSDLEEAARFVLPHRLRRAPEEAAQPQGNPEAQAADEPPETEGQEEIQEGQEGEAPQRPPSGGESAAGGIQQQEEDGERREGEENAPAPEEQVAGIDRSFRLPQLALDFGKDRALCRGSGKRSATRTDERRGRYVRAALAKQREIDLALDATIRAAAPYQKLRPQNGCALRIEAEDLRRKVREKRVGAVFLFLVDASGSMGAKARMESVKGAVFSMLLEAYQKRDQVGMIAFRRDRAETLLPVTRSVELAQKCLQKLPTGGKTPLAEGVEAALRVLSERRRREKGQQIVLVLVTDGRANASADNAQRALALAERVGAAKVAAVVIDTETDFIRLGIAREIAARMGAAYYPLQSLSKEKVLRVVRGLGEAARACAEAQR